MPKVPDQSHNCSCMTTQAHAVAGPALEQLPDGNGPTTPQRMERQPCLRCCLQLNTHPPH